METTQFDLFAVAARKRELERTGPFVAESETSRNAAIAIAKPSARLRRRVLEYVQRQGLYGATDTEGAAALGMNPSTYRPRRIELAEQGAVVDSGKTRPTESGRNAVVWVAATGGDDLVGP